MTWLQRGLGFSVTYIVVVLALASHPVARLWTADLAMLVSPLVAMVVVWQNRGRWRSGARVFWFTLAAAAGIWLVGQLGWAAHELLLEQPTPWLDWHVTLQLTGATLPMLAVLARPDRRLGRDAAAVSAVDIAVLATLCAFLGWTIIVAPSLVVGRAPLAMLTLSSVLLFIRAAVGCTFVWVKSRAEDSDWQRVYERLSIGALASIPLVAANSIVIGRGVYHSGTVGDLGWILPFWFTAWAASDAPVSQPEPVSRLTGHQTQTRMVLLFAAVAAVPVVGYGYRHLVPLGGPVDVYRELATAVALIVGVALALVRVNVEQRATLRAERGVRLLTATLEQVHEMIILVRGRQVAWANLAVVKGFGYTAAELEDLPLDRLMTDASFGEIRRMQDALARGEAVSITGEAARRDGSRFPAVCDAMPLVDVADDGAYFVAVVRDITGELRVRDQLVAGERFSAIAGLLGGLARELNSPLQSGIANIEVGLSETTVDGARPHLEQARADVARAGRIVRNLLTFVDKNPNERMLGELNEVVHAAVKRCVYDLMLERITLREDYTPSVPLVVMDREDIQQIVINLLHNAEKALGASEHGGTITVTTGLSGGNAVLEVADDGPGVPVELRSRIFEPYFTAGDGEEQTRLGLAISFNIAQAHGGALELVPSEVGTRFRLTLPGAGFAGPAHASGL